MLLYGVREYGTFELRIKELRIKEESEINVYCFSTMQTMSLNHTVIVFSSSMIVLLNNCVIVWSKRVRYFRGRDTNFNL